MGSSLRSSLRALGHPHQPGRKKEDKKHWREEMKRTEGWEGKWVERKRNKGVYNHNDQWRKHQEKHTEDEDWCGREKSMDVDQNKINK